VKRDQIAAFLSLCTADSHSRGPQPVLSYTKRTRYPLDHTSCCKYTEFLIELTTGSGISFSMTPFRFVFGNSVRKIREHLRNPWENLVVCQIPIYLQSVQKQNRE